MDKTIDELDLSVRAYNVLKANGLKYESEIRKISLADISKLRNIRKIIIYELEELLGFKYK
ncbi:DNA-directed RNA polymerase subunit alpha C-terminal domain-containing protein [Paenibacillus sp. FSL H3-0286]|uniref:DNA-directed RNA polymerase subunit alpha C-terminal domain-containing protein n=1 Tax=Paenibacillus sp. FSL H3-0286 TaxID=2921427 RepID=UPI00324CDB78